MLLQQLLLQGGTDIAIIIAAFIVGLTALWIIVSIPVWIAAKILTLGKARFTRAMLVTAAGPIIYAIVFFISAALLTVALGDPTIPVIIAFIAWIGVFKKGFDTGWLRALAIAILAIVVFAVIGVIVTLLVQAVVPGTPPVTPIPLQQV